MRTVLCLCALVLSFVIPRPAVEFLQPRSRIILAPPTGSLIPVQIRIEPHADNRAYQIGWCDGSSGHTLDGAEDSAVHPIKPLDIRVGPGTCDLVAVVMGAGGAERARTTMTLYICGTGEECVPK